MFVGGKSPFVETATRFRFAMNSEGLYIGWPLLGNGVFGELALAESTIAGGRFTSFALVRPLNGDELRKLARAPITKAFVLYSPPGSEAWALMICRPNPCAERVVEAAMMALPDATRGVAV